MGAVVVVCGFIAAGVGVIVLFCAQLFRASSDPEESVHARFNGHLRRQMEKEWESSGKRFYRIMMTIGFMGLGWGLVSTIICIAKFGI